MIAVFAVLVVSCYKESTDQSSYRTIYLPSEARELFNATLGEVRIYQDSATGLHDTARCHRARYDFIKTAIGDKVLFEEEEFSISYDHSFYRTNFSYLLRFPLVLGDSISDGLTSSYSVLQAYYPSIEIGNKTFGQVYLIKRKWVPSRFNSDADYYLAKNRGIVAIREYKTNKLWILQ